MAPSCLSKQIADYKSLCDCMAGEVGHGLSCFVSYVELKMAPINIIYVFSVLMEDSPVTLWLTTIPPSTSSVFLPKTQNFK